MPKQQKQLIKVVDVKTIDLSQYKNQYVGCLILTQDNKILTQQRGADWHTFPNYVSEFGGRIEPNETPLQAIRRELEEEVGAHVSEADICSLGVITEAITNDSDLIFAFFWHDRQGLITGCYEGEAKHFDNADSALKYPNIMDSLRWMITESLHRNFISNIRFEKASTHYQALIFQWLAKPHMQAFWDNSQEHKDDILNFINGRKQHYFYGTTKYWIGFIDDQPFAFILSDEILPSQEMNDLHRAYLSESGKTIALDFGIGNTAFLGKGLAALTLTGFTEFYKTHIDPKADTFFIDPDKNNPRAAHVYAKAGFEEVGSFLMPPGAFTAQETFLMVKKLE